jgi:hypothetical protein
VLFGKKKKEKKKRKKLFLQNKQYHKAYSYSIKHGNLLSVPAEESPLIVIGRYPNNTH